MGGINDKYTERERLSMALWDALCEFLPATKEERELSKRLDSFARMENGGKPKRELTPEQTAHQRELARQWRATHKEYIAEQKRLNRTEINDAARGRRASQRISAI